MCFPQSSEQFGKAGIQIKEYFYLPILVLLLVASCRHENTMTEKKYVEFILQRVEAISTLQKVKCPIMADEPSKVCYGLNMSLVDFAQKLRLAMYDDFKNPPYWQPTAGAYSGSERADYVTLKSDDKKHFSVTYIALNPTIVKEEEEIGRDMSGVKNFTAYVSFFFVTDQK
jgi:hypothetical protein